MRFFFRQKNPSHSQAIKFSIRPPLAAWGWKPENLASPLPLRTRAGLRRPPPCLMRPPPPRLTHARYSQSEMKSFGRVWETQCHASFSGASHGACRLDNRMKGNEIQIARDCRQLRGARDGIAVNEQVNLRPAKTACVLRAPPGGPEGVAALSKLNEFELCSIWQQRRLD